MRTEHPDNLALAKGELLREAASKFLRQIGHFIERLNALLVEPVCDLPRPVKWLTEFADLILEFLKLERPDIDFYVRGHEEGYGVRRCQQSCGGPTILVEKNAVLVRFRAE